MTLTDENLITMIPEISSIFNECKPEVIYCLNRSDAHSDHRITFNAVMACTKSFRYPYIKKILMYECLSETEFAPNLHEKAFIPNYFVNISKYLNKSNKKNECCCVYLRHKAILKIDFIYQYLLTRK